MHVIVNLQPLLTPLTGIGHYTRELTLALLDAGLRMDGVTGTRFEALDPGHPLLAAPTQAATLGASPLDERGPLWQLARRYLRNPLTRRAYRWLCSERLRRQGQRLARQGDTVYWEPNYVLLPWQGPSVLTIHDLSHERHPEFHPRERVEFFNRHLPESLAHASRINVVSQFTADELQALHGIDASRIDIVSPGVSERFFAVPDAPHATRVRQRHELPERFLLSVGTLEPRKNLVRVMQAFAELPRDEQRAAPLLLVGMQGWGEQTLSREIRSALEAGTVRRLGYVPGDDLPALYALASGFVYVSSYEGFGMPVIEAMAAGTPVLTANVTATAEVGGAAAISVPPGDITAIRGGLRQLLDENHEARIQQGRVRAERFTWQASAEALQASLHRALES
ncbi:glycosyltransferase family 4 protein [Halomonas lysinitropha]|uniref:Mannosylfructose-phosphate synthase n=1 Tax=Halomonas lysinitropha TaxID=2607506 RepID=A0A5K1I531_9GAMM|nr:glycosyltransferase family 1 protein [Halomonas lysinitropha]VVZ95267.1 Mannosylfructose-phosphate synthase [Halomonas lysinitropha]